MKLMRVGPRGAERPAILDETGAVRDLSEHVEDIAGEVLSDAGLERLRGLDLAALPRVAPGTRIAPCVDGIGKVVCVGLNFHDHAAETGASAPPEPLLFGKAVTAIAGPNDPVPTPRGSVSLDYEVELAIVIGARAQYVTEVDAMAHVAGFALFNDVSERDFQKHRAGQFIKGKSHDGFGPLGPWLVTRDAWDPAGKRMTTTVNGTPRQNGTTDDMIFGVAHVVSYISQFMTLMPGDVIPTGTPAGVAAGMTPPGYLRPGDEVELAIEGLGQQRQAILAAA